MIRFTSGDLLQAKAEALVNTVNTVGVMGKGIALQFKRRFPENYSEYRTACSKGQVRVGSMFVTRVHELGGPTWIINFPTKGHWKADSRIVDIEAGLGDLRKLIELHEIQSIAIPPLGAGNGNLPWSEVRPLITEALAGLDGVDIQIFEPADGHRSVAGVRVPLTGSRALVMMLIEAYVARRRALEPWELSEGASHLEIQKLMYFADVLTPELRLRFAQGKYGPYSDVVRHIVSDLEGSYISGFGDGADRTLDLEPITVTDGGRIALEKFRSNEAIGQAAQRLTDQVMDRISGFEGPYLIELLASVDWARHKAPQSDAATVSSFVRDWTPRKGRLFTHHHIEVALDRLVRSEN